MEAVRRLCCWPRLLLGGDGGGEFIPPLASRPASAAAATEAAMAAAAEGDSWLLPRMGRPLLLRPSEDVSTRRRLSTASGREF